jgi:multiple antibiotic resistance protein
MLDALLKFLVLLFVVIEPPSLVPIFASMTEGAPARWCRRMAVKSCLLAAAIMIAFGLGGGRLIHLLGISIDAFRIGGGIMLFLIALEMVFVREEKTTAEEQAETRRRRDISVFPLAFPLISGPGALATVLLTFGAAEGNFWLQLGYVAVILVAMALTLLCMLTAPLFMRFVGVTGANVISRLAGVILAALAVQFIIDGLKGAFALG